MRLVNELDLSESQRQHTWPSEQALELVQQALLDRQPIEGLGQLRAGLLIDLDSEVLGLVERGEWRLLRPEADYVDWVLPDRAFDPKVMALMQNPPEQPSRSPRIYRLFISTSGEPMLQQHYIATVDGGRVPRRTDVVGIAHLFVADSVRRISMAVVGS